MAANLVSLFPHIISSHNKVNLELQMFFRFRPRATIKFEAYTIAQTNSAGAYSRSGRLFIKQWLVLDA
ncbi:MAG: hypothetical protein CMM55_09945 [Rhodospirillaceae bacterium]|nr:hypothetical protein [Rhodospirillaceae bacterium]